MTADQDFKALVRARMRSSGVGYTAARAQLVAERDTAVRRQQQLVARWFDGDALRAIPARHKVRVAVLLQVLTRFVPGEELSEVEVNERLRPVHEDVAYLRRELVGVGYLERADGTYRLAHRAPVREERLRRELPDWERIWLPGFLAGATRTSPSERLR